MASRPHNRPLSPHLGIWKWGPHMAASIAHRVAGVGMAIVGVPLFTWWLAATAAGDESYTAFRDVFTGAEGGLNIIGWVVGVGLTFAFFEHMATGVRHLVLDTGAGYELRRNKLGALACPIVAAVLTAAFWLWMGLR